MKKILGFLLVLLLTTACGDRNKVSKPSVKGINSVIKASELISRDDASYIVGQPMRDRKPAKRPFADEGRYSSQDYHFVIVLIQEAAHDKSREVEVSLLQNGWAHYISQMKGAYSVNNYQQNIIDFGDTDGESYLQDGRIMGSWLLHIFYGDYYMSVVVSNTSLSRKDTEDEMAWKRAKAKEAGELAVKRLKARLGTRK